jgi:hypothetical protein
MQQSRALPDGARNRSLGLVVCVGVAVSMLQVAAGRAGEEGERRLATNTSGT